VQDNHHEYRYDGNGNQVEKRRGRHCGGRVQEILGGAMAMAREPVLVLVAAGFLWCGGCADISARKEGAFVPEGLLREYVDGEFAERYTYESGLSKRLRREGLSPSQKAPREPSCVFQRDWTLAWVLPRSRLDPVFLLDVDVVPELLNLIGEWLPEMER